MKLLMLFCNVSFLVFDSQDAGAVIGKLKGAVEALHALPSVERGMQR